MFLRPSSVRISSRLAPTGRIVPNCLSTQPRVPRIAPHCSKPRRFTTTRYSTATMGFSVRNPTRRAGEGAELQNSRMNSMLSQQSTADHSSNVQRG